MAVLKIPAPAGRAVRTDRVPAAGPQRLRRLRRLRPADAGAARALRRRPRRQQRLRERRGRPAGLAREWGRRGVAGAARPPGARAQGDARGARAEAAVRPAKRRAPRRAAAHGACVVRRGRVPLLTGFDTCHAKPFRSAGLFYRYIFVDILCAGTWWCGRRTRRSSRTR